MIGGSNEKWIFGLPYWTKWAVLFLFVSCVVVSVFIWIGFEPYRNYKRLDEAGQFGDSFGFVNAVFSSLAFSGVVVTLMMQITELRNQREELSRTRRSHEEIASLNLVNSYLSTLETFERVTQEPVPEEKSKRAATWFKINRMLQHFERRIDSFLTPHMMAESLIGQINYGLLLVLKASEDDSVHSFCEHPIEDAMCQFAYLVEVLRVSQIEDRRYKNIYEILKRSYASIQPVASKFKEQRNEFSISKGTDREIEAIRTLLREDSGLIFQAFDLQLQNDRDVI